MQKYKEINGNDYVKNSRTTINETMQSIQSMNSGTAFPTNNLFEGMKCYRTDLKKTYTLTDVENNTWVEDAHATLSDEATHAASATKLDTARSLNLSGAVTADAATFDGTANATINVKTLDATKLKGTASVSTTGNAATATKVVTTAAAGTSANIAEATMASSDSARIRVSGAENAGELALETADDGNEAIVARQYTGTYTTPVRTAKILDESGNTSFPGTVVAPKFTGALNGNAATATKLQTPRTLSLTGNASGSTTFDGSGNVNINTTVNTINNQGDKTAIKDGTTEPAGLNLYKVYNNGYPAPCGNLISIGGKGGGELLAEWSGTDREIGHLYYRNRRDMASVWSNWSTIAFTTDINDYAPTKTGGGASGTWDINISGTATKLATARTISLTGNASGSATFDGTSDVSINVSVSQAAHADKATNAGSANKLFYSEHGGNSIQNGANDFSPTVGGDSANMNITSWHGVSFTNGCNSGVIPQGKTAVGIDVRNSVVRAKTFEGTLNGSSATATKLATARAISLTGNASGSANFDGSGNVSINTTVNESKHAAAADTAANANKLASESGSNYLFINTEEDNWSVIGPNPGYWLKSIRTDVDAPPYSIGNYSTAIAFGGYDTKGIITHAYGRPDVKFAGGGGSTANWKFTIHGGSNNEVYDLNNFPTKTGGGASGTWGINISGNADTVDGYHASDLLRTLGGNRTPVITDIFDRAGTIDMSTMSAADKATHKANINKATNMTQNIWNNTTGIHAYGGDTDMNGYKRGTLKLTQSYKNFDKILVFGTNDEGDEVIPRLYDAWELTYLFSHSYRFLLFCDTAIYWELHGSVRAGTNTGYALSTDTIWSCEKQSSGIIGIYGIKY